MISGKLSHSSVGISVFSFRSTIGVIAALREDVDTKARLGGQRVGRVARAPANQVGDVPLVFAHEVQRHHLGLEGRQLLDGRIAA